MTQLGSTTFVSESVLMIRNIISGTVADPVSASRPSDTSFVTTSYPLKSFYPPVITIRNINIATQQRMGMASNQHFIDIPIEVRVWAKNEIQKEGLTGSIISQLLAGQSLGANTTTGSAMYNMSITSAVNVDEPGEAGIRSKVIELNYRAII